MGLALQFNSFLEKLYNFSFQFDTVQLSYLTKQRVFDIYLSSLWKWNTNEY